MSDPDLREILQGAPMFGDGLPGFDPASAPADPGSLFVRWLTEAVQAGVRAPQAMTLSTLAADGRPDARILILRELSGDTWRFASSRLSPKGEQLAAAPAAALTFHWPEVGRQVRIRGPVRDTGPEGGARDFLARPEGSRAESSSSRQSRPLADPSAVAEGLAAARARVAADPHYVPDHWALYALEADWVEFWQADPGRAHVRLAFVRGSAEWVKQTLWP